MFWQRFVFFYISSTFTHDDVNISEHSPPHLVFGCGWRRYVFFLLLIVFLLLFFMLLCCQTDKNKQEKNPQTFVSVINIYRAFIWLFHNVVWRHFPVCGCVLINLYCVICSCLLFSQPRVTVVNVFYSSRTADVFCTNYALCKFIKPFVVFSRYISILLCLNHDSISGSR